MSGAQQSLAMCESCGLAGVHLGPFEDAGRSWELLCVACKRAIVEADPEVLAKIERLRADRADLDERRSVHELAAIARAGGIGGAPLESVEVVRVEATSSVEEAAGRGYLRLEVEERPLYSAVGHVAYPFEPRRDFPVGEQVRVVHAISVLQGFEVRGYVIARGIAYERTPVGYPWPEMDAWVCSQLGVTLADGGRR